MTDQLRYDHTVAGVTQAAGAASAGTTLPGGGAGSQGRFYAIAAATNVHWRTGIGAQTAVASDPMLPNAAGVVIIWVPPNHDNFAVIQDSAGGNFTISPVVPD